MFLWTPLGDNRSPQIAPGFPQDATRANVDTRQLTRQRHCITNGHMSAKTEYDPVTSIRMPVDLKRALKERAVAEGRTFSQQVVWYLRQHVDVAKATEPKPAKRK